MSDLLIADHKLPRWWLWCFLFATVFGAFYWYWYGALEASPGPLDQYIAARAAALDTGEEVTGEMLRELAEDELTLRAGSQEFAKSCTRCHGGSGEGGIGPNLTDPYWIGGGSPLDIYDAIVNGRGRKGMPSWGLKLGPGACKQLAAYVLSIRGENLPGKAPEGEKWKPDGTE